MQKVLLTYGLVITLDAISFGIIGPILAPLLTHPGTFFALSDSPFFHYFLYGVLTVLFPFSYMLFAPLLGMLSDNFGRRKILLMCSSLITLSFLGYALAFLWKSIGLFILSRLMGGIGAGSQGVAQAGVMDFAKENEKPRTISTIAIGMTMGLVLGPLISTLWRDNSAWLPFGLAMLLSLINLFCVWKYVLKQSAFHTTSRKAFFKCSLSDSNIIRLFSIFFIFELGWSLYLQTLPLWLSTRWHAQSQMIGLTTSYIGSLLSLFLFLGIRTGLKFTSLVNLIRIGFLVGIFGLYAVTLNVSLLTFLLMSTPIILTVALAYPGLIGSLSELIPSEHQGLLMGFSDAFLAFAFTITGMLSSLLFYINPIFPFWIACLFWIIAIVLYTLHVRNLNLESTKLPYRAL